MNALLSKLASNGAKSSKTSAPTKRKESSAMADEAEQPGGTNEFASPKKRSAPAECADSDLVAAIMAERDEFQPSEIAAGTSTTSLVESAPPLPVAALRAPEALECSLPKPRMCGGQTPRGTLFYCTYVHSHTLMFVLGTLSKIDTQTPLVFSRDGAFLELLDSNSMLVNVSVPRSSFAQFEGLFRGGAANGRLEITVESEEIKKLVSTCNASYSLTFVYDDHGDSAAPLDLMLCPRLASSKARTLQHRLLAQNRDRGETLEIPDEQQFRVYVPPHTFATDITTQTRIAMRLISLGISESGFTIGAISSTPPYAVVQECSYSVQRITPEQAATPGVVGAITASGECAIVDLRPAGAASNQFPLSAYGSFRARSALVATFCQVAGAGACTSLSIDLCLRQLAPGAPIENYPLHFRAGLHENGAAPLSVDYWIAESTDAA